MAQSRLGWFARKEKRYDALIIVLWTVSFTSVFLRAIYTQASAGLLDDVIVIGICLVAGTALRDIGKIILGYFIAIPGGMLLVFFLTILPALNGTIPPPSDQLLISLWISILVKMIFPIQFLAFLVASVIGSLIGERYL